MNINIKSIFKQLTHSPKDFPVETFLSIVFFCFAVYYTKHETWSDASILLFFVPLMALTFCLHSVNRWAYVISGFVFVPLMVIDLQPFIMTYGFAFTYVLAAILLVVGNRRMDNKSFAAHVLHVVMQGFFALLISGMLTIAVEAVIASFFYIFGIDNDWHIYQYVLEFIWFVIASQLYCMFIRKDEYKVSEPAHVLQIILNFIFSPAVIVYTVILYAYFIKIVMEWDLPKGGVAWMVMAFVTASLAGCLMQHILTKRYYDWYYSKFGLIAIPPLIMYWIGSVYRINLYSFTESRLYLLLAGLLMTLFVIMLQWRKSRKFQLMALISGVTICLFTYVPYISAKNIGLMCQKKKMHRQMKELNLLDKKTGKLCGNIEIKKIVKDSLLCAKYADAFSSIEYVRTEMGKETFDSIYGNSEYSVYSFMYGKDVVALDDYYRKGAIDLRGFDMLLPSDKYSCEYRNGIVRISNYNSLVLEYPINAEIKKNPQLLDDKDKLLVHSNDSLMLVLNSISIQDSEVIDISYDFILLRKR